MRRRRRSVSYYQRVRVCIRGRVSGSSSTSRVASSIGSGPSIGCWPSLRCVPFLRCMSSNGRGPLVGCGSSLGRGPPPRWLTMPATIRRRREGSTRRGRFAAPARRFPMTPENPTPSRSTADRISISPWKIGMTAITTTRIPPMIMILICWRSAGVCQRQHRISTVAQLSASAALYIF